MFGSRSTSVAGQYSRLLGMATVQKELNLSEEQKAKVQEISEKDSTARREMFTGLRDVGETERQAAMEQLGKKMQAQREESRKAMEAVLLPEQRTRLRQIALQVTGFDAIYDEEVQRELGLTELTAAVIRSISRRSGDKIRSSFKPGGDPQTAMAKVEEIRKETEQQVLSVLTDAQKAALEQMKGTKLEIPDSELRGRSPFGSRGSRGSRGPGGEDRGSRGDRPRDENR